MKVEISSTIDVSGIKDVTEKEIEKFRETALKFSERNALLVESLYYLSTIEDAPKEVTDLINKIEKCVNVKFENDKLIVKV